MKVTAKENVRIIAVRANSLFRILPNGNSYIIHKGIFYTQNEFDIKFPHPTKVQMEFDKKYLKGEDIDTTRKWQHLPKSE